MRGGLAGCRYRLLSIGGQIGCSDVRTYPDVRGFHYRDVLSEWTYHRLLFLSNIHAVIRFNALTIDPTHLFDPPAS